MERSESVSETKVAIARRVLWFDEDLDEEGPGIATERSNSGFFFSDVGAIAYARL